MNRDQMARTTSEGHYISFDFKKLEKNAINKLIAVKSIGHALTRLHLHFDFDGKKRVSLTALAQNCFNLEHLDLQQALEKLPNILNK